MSYYKMLSLHPIIRLLSAGLLLLAVFLAKTVEILLIVYVVIISVIFFIQLTKKHIQFVAYITLPLLLALLFVWGWAIKPDRIPAPHDNGIVYALFLWIRVVASGAILQSLFFPLIDKPVYLRSFLHKTGLKGAMGTLIITSIVFLPEVNRRLSRITDARKVQGYAVSGFRGLLAMPALLMPLVSSLLETAMIRAEFWNHRGVLEREFTSNNTKYSIILSTLSILISLTVFILVITDGNAYTQWL